MCAYTITTMSASISVWLLIVSEAIFSCISCNAAEILISTHSVFAGERLREAGVPGLNTQLIKEIPSMWKALSDGAKQVCAASQN